MELKVNNEKLKSLAKYLECKAVNIVVWLSKIDQSGKLEWLLGDNFKRKKSVLFTREIKNMVPDSSIRCEDLASPLHLDEYLISIGQTVCYLADIESSDDLNNTVREHQRQYQVDLFEELETIIQKLPDLFIIHFISVKDDESHRLELEVDVSDYKVFKQQVQNKAIEINLEKQEKVKYDIFFRDSFELTLNQNLATIIGISNAIVEYLTLAYHYEWYLEIIKCLFDRLNRETKAMIMETNQKAINIEFKELLLDIILGLKSKIKD